VLTTGEGSTEGGSGTAVGSIDGGAGGTSGAGGGARLTLTTIPGWLVSGGGAGASKMVVGGLVDGGFFAAISLATSTTSDSGASSIALNAFSFSLPFPCFFFFLPLPLSRFELFPILDYSRLPHSPVLQSRPDRRLARSARGDAVEYR